MSDGTANGYVLGNMSYINGTTELRNATFFSGNNASLSYVYMVQWTYNRTTSLANDSTFQTLQSDGSTQVYFLAYNMSAGVEAGVRALNVSPTSNLTGYNFTIPEMPAGLQLTQRFGPSTTNWSTIANFSNATIVFEMQFNFSSLGINFSAVGMTEKGTDFHTVGILNFTALNLRASNIGTQLGLVGNAINMTIKTRQWENSSIFVNSTALSSFNSPATLKMFNLPFRGRPNIAGITESSVTFSYVYGPGGGNLTFNVTGFSQYNISDTTVPKIVYIAPTNGTGLNDSTPFINITFNGTGTDIRNNTINITVNGISYYHNDNSSLSNMTCEYYDASTTETIACRFNMSVLTNGTRRINVIAQDYGLSENTGNSVTSWINFTVASGNGTVTSVTLSDSSPTKNGNVTFTIVFSRLLDTGIKPNVNLTFSNGNVSGLIFLNFTNGTTTTTWYGSFNFSKNDSLYPNGVVGINITGAVDVASNNIIPNHTNTFIFDSQEPFITLITANNTNQSSVALLYNFTDNLSATASCRLFLNTTLNVTNSSVTNISSSSISITDSTVNGATLNWTIECTDLADNRINATTNTVFIDQSAPTANATMSSPSQGQYVRASTSVDIWQPIITVNISDSYVGILNTTLGRWVSIYKDGSLVKNVTSSSSPSITVTGSGGAASARNLKLEANLSAITAPIDGNEISAITYAIDHAGNLLTYNLTFTIDNTAPTVGAQITNGSTLTQGQNLVLNVTITDLGAGLNTTIADFGINTTAYTMLGHAINMTCTGSRPTFYCSYTYNTTNLQAGNLRLNGTIKAVDNTTTRANNATAAVALDFTITDAGVPTRNSSTIVETNVSRLVKNVLAIVRINLSVSDDSGINTVWATYAESNSSTETCTFFSGGDQTRTTVNAIGNCSILANESGGTVSSNVLTLSIYANDTTGAGNSAVLYSQPIIVENERINVSRFTAPSKIFGNQTITINTTVFSWNETPKVNFNVTNSTSTAGIILIGACIVADANARLYYCSNTNGTSGEDGTGLHLAIGNQSTISVQNATYSSGNDTSLPSAITTTVYANKSVVIGTVPLTSTINFIDSGVSISGSATYNTSISSAVQDVRITDTTLNSTIITLNDVNVTAIVNFTFYIVAPNSSNGTNYTTIQASIGASTATLMTAIVIQPVINYSSTTAFTSTFTGSTIAFNCTALGITCSATTKVYKASFNTTSNLTTSTWTVLTAPTPNSDYTVLTQAVDSFSIFALATPYVAPAAAAAAASSSSSGGGGGGIGYKLVGKVTAFDLIDMIRDFYKGASKKTAFDIIDTIRKFYEGGSK